MKDTFKNILATSEERRQREPDRRGRGEGGEGFSVLDSDG